VAIKKKSEGGLSPSYSSYTAKRSFVKRFSKRVSTSPENLLHQHSHNRSCHNSSHSRVKHTLNITHSWFMCWRAINYWMFLGFNCRQPKEQEARAVPGIFSERMEVSKRVSWPGVLMRVTPPAVRTYVRACQLDRSKATSSEVNPNNS
jgi:hypothetical protein